MNGRIIASVAAGALGGFLVGLVVFREPWHLQPNFGDVPTWLAASFALGAGWVALRQLGILQTQVRDEALRSEKRDQLLDQQLAEAERRIEDYRRRGAEGVHLNFRPHHPDALALVTNYSQRPISDVACVVLSGPERTTAAEPDATAFVTPGSEQQGNELKMPLHWPRSRLCKIPPEGIRAFVFNGLQQPPDDPLLVIWFTDDAGHRWQLDEFQSLTEAADGDRYKP